MYGIVTRNEAEVSWDEFDRAFYEVKDVTGRTAAPVAGSTSMISCFGDNRVREEQPDLVPVSEDGDRATRDRKYFDWSYVCPNASTYRDQLLDRIEDVVEVTGDLRLDDVGFPRPEYCHCHRCEAAFADSPHDDWWRWRESVITGFVEDVRDVVPGRLLMTLYPNPYPGHLSKRAGIDPDALASVVDEFVVPLYDMAYETTYWLEIIAQGFQDALACPFSIELYAVNIDHENLVQAATVADAYAHSVLFAYDAEAARRVITAVRESDTDEAR
jgi:hypothetical protein